MASQDKEDEHNYEQLKREHQLLKEKFLQLQKEHQELLASVQKDSSDNENTQNQDPEVIKPQFKKPLSTDPFEALVPELVDKILKYLTPKETLVAMSVSDSWKSFIESRKKRLDEAMDKIVLKVDSLDINKMTHKALDLILDGGRKYKHMEADFHVPITMSYLFPMRNYAWSLESLKINCKSSSSFHIDPLPVDFPNLKQLVVIDDCKPKIENPCHHQSLMNFIKASSFPEVTRVKIFEFDYFETSLNEFMQKFPKLNVLLTFSQLLYSRDEDPSGWYGWWEDEPLISKLPYESFEGQPKIEALFLQVPVRNLLSGMKDTLTEFYVDNINIIGLKEVLESLVNLKILTVCEILYEFDESNDFVDLDAVLPDMPHDHLQSFKIEDCYLSDQKIEQLLRNFTSLTNLAVNWNIDEDFVEFLVSNMQSLKEISCRNATDEVMEYYKDLKKNRKEGYNGRSVNTNFDIILVPELKHFRQEFYDKHFES